MIFELKQLAVFFEEESLQHLEQVYTQKDYSKVAILCDSNTHEHCLSDFLASCPFLPGEQIEILELEPGEDTKSIEVLAQLWDAMRALGLDRNSLVINLGGGVICDLGGFAASTYMRGIDFVNFPTSLLAMVDASLGSKTGINFGGYKNRIGLFADPLMVGIIPNFLQSLPADELASGWAEMLKHGLIADFNHYQDLIRRKPKAENLNKELIEHSVSLKAKVVKEDKKEGGQRKILNFGHSVGHALESYYHQAGMAISHGHAVALGMQVELALSATYAGLGSQEASSMIAALKQFYAFPKVEIEAEVFHQLLAGDKKNRGGQLRLVLLAEPGKAVYDVEVPAESIWSSLQDQLL